MTKYEVAVVFQPEVKDGEKIIEKIIADNKGKIVATDAWGKKELAYKIAGETHGLYYIFTVELENAAVAKVDQILNIADGVLRHLIVKFEEHVPTKEPVKEAEKEEK
jgi:small subunit ribosomal protein S6